MYLLLISKVHGRSFLHNSQHNFLVFIYTIFSVVLYYTLLAIHYFMHYKWIYYTVPLQLQGLMHTRLSYEQSSSPKQILHCFLFKGES